MEVYQLALSLATDLFERTRSWPREERYALTSQLRRASRSIGASIAEAWGKRNYPRYFMSKLTEADSEQLETRHWIAVAANCGYLSRADAEEFLDRLSVIGKMLNRMLEKADQFCRTP